MKMRMNSLQNIEEDNTKSVPNFMTRYFSTSQQPSQNSDNKINFASILKKATSEKRLKLKDYLQLQEMKSTRKIQNSSTVKRQKTLSPNHNVSLDEEIAIQSKIDKKDKKQLQLARDEAVEELKKCGNQLQILLQEIESLKQIQPQPQCQNEDITFYCQVFRQAKEEIHPKIYKVAQLLRKNMSRKGERIAEKVFGFSTSSLQIPHKKEMRHSKKSMKRIVYLKKDVD